LYDFLTSNDKTTDIETLQSQWDINEDRHFIQSLIDNFDSQDLNIERQPFTIAEFSSCFHLRQLSEKDSPDKIGDDISIDMLQIADPKFSNRQSLLKLSFHLGKKAQVDFDSAK
jgi:hypothetical protein